MDMFQAPTFLEEPFGSRSVLHAAEKESDAGQWTDGKYAAKRQESFD